MSAATAPAVAAPAEKRCPKCGDVKPLTAYSRRRGGRPQSYCKPCTTGTLNRWLEDPENRARAYASTDASRARFPEKVSARQKLQAAVRSGRVKKGPCEVGIECDGEVHGHHERYDRPLEVRWLCRRHHEAVHRRGHLATDYLSAAAQGLV